MYLVEMHYSLAVKFSEESIWAKHDLVQHYRCRAGLDWQLQQAILVPESELRAGKPAL